MNDSMFLLLCPQQSARNITSCRQDKSSDRRRSKNVSSAAHMVKKKVNLGSNTGDCGSQNNTLQNTVAVYETL